MLIPTKHTDALGSETEVTKIGAQKNDSSADDISKPLLRKSLTGSCSVS